ncbi:ribosome-recycling factor, chloroplastic isoform X2 [Syzygium oleosum]|uniref:ribosome-recycling factor, chloroplastic isoform X2 n=1 Tax=Syzygium oleosum TaxID=219896 RepID=UPI0024B89EDB|nr:ribosome-recycling factor, chloroplastic isoform X2 [Syzygium oleosum]
MASPFSHAPPVRSVLRPKPSPPRSLLALRDSCRGRSDGSGCSLRSAASYVSIRGGAGAAKLRCERRVNPGRLLPKSWTRDRNLDWRRCSPFNFLNFEFDAIRLSQRGFDVSSQHELELDLSRAGVVTCATTEEIEAEKSMIEKDVKQRMEKTIETVRSKFNSVRTGRANPAMLDKVEVEYYGSPVSLKSIAQISTPEASSLLIQPYDKSSLKAIEKAIVSSDLGMTPNNDGEVIRLSLPQLTTERRKELSKVVARQAEEGKEKKLSEDNVKDLSGDLQKLTDDYMKKIDTIYKQKEKELLTV